MRWGIFEEDGRSGKGHLDTLFQDAVKYTVAFMALT